ncbi:DUF1684 domain-containing protein [Acanthopleuribacter pedis]|uniref:DUF1684 domain-containing protein n=1 Tax=Acanthopleuribacter pedis TaxID=442870 RepID=A0A8J7U3H7_9BACT|nr:DUF1684 domain-containing protein [Acanthopleuribacter pedis]MBO1320433.1 DUF1684 domain-containing protein [Acanthopleuribacter pedis]
MILVTMLLFLATPDTASSFEQAELTWRADHEQEMKSDNSWLNLVGLFWLQEGANTFGTATDADFVLPRHATVLKAGTFFLENGKVRYEMARGQRAVVDGKAALSGPLAMDNVLHHNHMRFFLIKRGDRLAVRIRDLRAGEFVNFQSLSYYSPKAKFVIKADYEAYESPQILRIGTVIGTEIELIVPGVIRFALDGVEHELLPTLESEEDDKFFLMFKDQTSGSTTYSGGRYLYADLPVDGKVTLNFNRATNPPCAYTPYATCPLPPAENWMNLAIEAGERTYKAPEKR